MGLGGKLLGKGVEVEICALHSQENDWPFRYVDLYTLPLRSTCVEDGMNDDAIGSQVS